VCEHMCVCVCECMCVLEHVYVMVCSGVQGTVCVCMYVIVCSGVRVTGGGCTWDLLACRKVVWWVLCGD